MDVKLGKVLTYRVVFLVWNKETGSSKINGVQLQAMNMSMIKTLFKGIPRSLISRDGIGRKVKVTIRLNDDVI